MAAKQGSTTAKHQLPAAAAAAAATVPAGEMDPRFDWIDNAASYVLRLHLQGFKKDDFRVQVDGAGRLTVRGQRAGAAGAHPSCFHKVFQLPSAAILDDISGRFEAGVLTLTVPKRATTAPPTTIEDLIMKPVKEAATKDQVHGTAAKQTKDDGGAEKKEAKPKEEISKVGGVPEKKESAAAKLKEEISKVDGVPEKKESAAAKLKEEISKVDGVPEKESAVAKLKEEISKVGADVKNKVMDEAAAAAGKLPLPHQQHKHEAKKPEQTPTPMSPVRTGDVKDAKVTELPAKAPESATATEKKPKKTEAAGEKGKKAIEQEEIPAEERAKAAADESEPEKKASWCGGWKELVPEDLVDMKWADDLVETARNNKELIAATIAAFSLGFLLSHKLFSRN